MNQSLLEGAKIVMPDLPLAAGTEFATAGNGVHMENYRRCLIILGMDQAGAGTGTVTLKQGTSASAATALAFARYWKNETGVTTDALTKVTATTLTTAGANTSGLNLYAFDVQASDLTTDNLNDWVRLNMASLSNNTAVFLMYILYDPRYPAAADATITGLA